MDISETIAPNSDQVNADDLAGGERTVTITGIDPGTKDQPVFIHLAEFPGRTYRPGKSMRRVLVEAWGKEASTYVGRRMTIFNDHTVKWAGQAVGGIRISHLSHISGPVTLPLTVTRGKREPFTVNPITGADPAVVAEVIDTLNRATSLPALVAAWDLAGVRRVQAHPDVVAAKDKRKSELQEEPPDA